MEKLHFCWKSARLIGPDYVLPVEPSEFYSGCEEVIIGCIRLKCRHCNEFVQIEPDPVPEGQGFRTYRCACIVLRETGPSRTVDYEDPETNETSLPWACAGHPVATLPFVLDGVTIARDTDFTDLTRRALSGWCPDAARPGERSSPIGWVLKLHARLLDTGLDDRVSRAVATLVTDADPRVRSASLRFFAACNSAAGGEVVETLVAGDRTLFENVPDPLGTTGDTLESVLYRALMGRVFLRDHEGRPMSPRALELVKEAVLRTPRGRVLYSGLATVAPEWLAENAAAIARTGQDAWYWLMISIPDDRLGEAVRQLAHVPGMDLEHLRRFVERRLDEDDPERHVTLDVLVRKRGTNVTPR